MTAHSGVLERIERYYDSVPRATATVGDHGAFVLFVATGPWPFYARPRLGNDRPSDRDRDLVAVLERQRELGVQQALEWVAEVSPAAEQAALRAGLGGDCLTGRNRRTSLVEVQARACCAQWA